MSDGMSAEEILTRAAENAMPRVAATIMAMTEKGNAVGLERAADTLDALADDIIAGRAPVTGANDQPMAPHATSLENWRGFGRRR